MYRGVKLISFRTGRPVSRFAHGPSQDFLRASLDERTRERQRERSRQQARRLTVGLSALAVLLTPLIQLAARSRCVVSAPEHESTEEY
ncbi:MAG: hypothetical protein U0559_09270 [Anaerolineae bacterium]